MVLQRRAAGVRITDFGPVVVANLLPLGGIVLFSLSFDTVFLLYLFELLTLFVAYGCCAMFAQGSPVDEDDYVTTSKAGGDDGWLARLPTVQLHDSVPALHLSNLRIVLPSMLIAIAVVVLIGQNIVGSKVGGGPSTWVGALTEPTRTLPALVIVVSHGVYVFRNYFRPGNHRSLSPEAVMELPTGLTVLLFAGFGGWVMSFGIITFIVHEGTSAAVAEPVGLTLFVGGFFVLRTSLEWVRFRAERVPDPGGVAGWLAPEEFRAAWGE